ncbi:MAG: autotransporter domain-containing protein [Rhizobiaceae bacterium]
MISGFSVGPRKRPHVFSFFLFLIAVVLPSLAAGQTATITFDASGDGNPVVTATAFDGQQLTSPAVVNVGDVVDFEWNTPGLVHRGLANLPDGCGASFVSEHKWTATITGDCRIHFETMYLSTSPDSGNWNLTEGSDFSLQIEANKGVGSPTFSLGSGSLPRGMSLSASGLVSGIPTERGRFDFDVRFDDGYGGTGYSGPLRFNVITAPPALANPVSATVNYGSSDNLISLDITGGAPASVEVASSPGHGSATASGTEIRYTPTTGYSGSDSFTYTATNSSGTSAPATVSITVGPAPTRTVSWTIVGPGRISSTTFLDDFPAPSLSSPVEVDEGRNIAFWSADADAGAALKEPPTGCGIFAAGSAWYTASITADCHVTFNFEEITFSPAALPDAVKGERYSQQISASGSYLDFTYSITGGDIAHEFSISSDGKLTGTPTETGSHTIEITATNSRSERKTQTYTFNVAEIAEITIDPTTIPDGEVGASYGPLKLTASGGTAPYTFRITAGVMPAGISLRSDGTIQGTPTNSGIANFTVEVTDANSATAMRSYSLTIKSPDVLVSVPSLPDGKVNTAYPGVRLIASGGTGPYEFAVVAGKLPNGVQLTADGAISGTPTEAGDFTATAQATDRSGFTGTADLSLKIKGLDVPVARDMTLEVMAGTTGSIDLTQGATNGPFTAADIATHPAAEAGKATIRHDGATHMLDFAAAGAFAGSASLQYTLSNADGRSAPATVILHVIARPDPSQDPEVIGLLTAQTETAKRFAKTQIQNFNRRLEQLHEEGDRRRNSVNVNIGMTERDSDKTAYADEERDRDPVADAFRRMDSGKKDEQASSGQDAYNPLGNFAVWTGGYVNFAKADSGGLDLDSTLVGVSGGVDYRFSPKFVAGLGFGYGRDKTEIGDNGTESRGRVWSMAAYGSYKPAPNVFIDGLLGYGFMDFDSRRFVTANGNFATGSRGGRQVFGSLTAGYEYRDEAWLVSPYGRLEASRSKLDGFTEQGGGIYGLTYGDQTVDTLSGVLGLRLEYAMPMDWGVLKPRARLEYTHDFEGSSRVSLGYTDVGTMPYGIDVDPFSRDYLTIGLGVDAQIGDAWNLGFDYRTAYGSGGAGRDHTFAIKVGSTF